MAFVKNIPFLLALATTAIAMTGKVAGLAVVVEFADVKAAHTQAEVDEFFGSIYDYFYDVSNGRLEYTNVVTPIITLPNEKAYYDNPENSALDNADILITDALNILNNMNFDLSGVTVNGDTVVALNIFYAGGFTREGIYLHSGTYEGGAVVNGISFERYQITSMDITGSGLPGSFGVVVHETGHLLFGWPDLYGPEELNRSNSIGDWCIMADNRDSLGGTPPNAYFKHLAGWIDTVDITNALPGTVFAIGANSDTAFVYRRNAREAYFIEARRHGEGRNKGIPGSGLAIWHIYKGGVALVQADGRNDLEDRVNFGDDTDLFRLGVKTEFNSKTTPAAIWHDRKPSNIAITDISDTGAVMTFKIGYEKKAYFWKALLLAIAVAVLWRISNKRFLSS